MNSQHQHDGSLKDLLIHGLQDMYYAEKRIHQSLPKMIEAAEDPMLRSGLSDHRDETAQQIVMLEQAFQLMGFQPSSERCDATDGILKEGDHLLANFKGKPAGDAAIVFAAQAVEHYEITRYGSLRTYAEQLGLNDVAQLLQLILAQEEAADAKLTQVAEGGVNARAAGSAGGSGSMSGSGSMGGSGSTGGSGSAGGSGSMGGSSGSTGGSGSMGGSGSGSTGGSSGSTGGSGSSRSGM